MEKKIVYIDLDNTVANYNKGVALYNTTHENAKRIAGFFENLPVMPGAVEAYNKLSEHFNVYFLTTSPWSNPYAAAEKLMWIKKNFPNAYKNVIISHHKDLNYGHYLIDDMAKNGAANFGGEWIYFGSEKFNNWEAVVNYILEKEHIS